MCHATTVVRSGEMGYLTASMLTGTLKRYVKDTPHSPEELVNVHLGIITLTQ
jgi:hypothetical protein